MRRVVLRPGVVLWREGGMIKQIFLPLYLGIGGRMGEGSQPMPWIHVKDLAGLVVHSVKMEDDILMFSAMKVIRRLTKQKDRVEFDNRDLIAGSEFAESLPGSLRVLGWYHSHPHITVHPSHVDCIGLRKADLLKKLDNMK